MPPGETMAERRANDGADAAGPPPLPPADVFCTRCAADVGGLPPAARFCNRCGFALPEGFPERRPSPQAGRPLPSPDPLPPEPFRPPLILLAYAKAMFNLGDRYEHAIGSRRNLGEAARCYWKAARLGDAAARERLAARPADDRAVLAYPPPVPLPLPGSLIVRDPIPPFAAVYRTGVS